MTASRFLGGLKIFDFLEMQELILGREMQFQYRRIHFRYKPCGAGAEWAGLGDGLDEPADDLRCERGHRGNNDPGHSYKLIAIERHANIGRICFTFEGSSRYPQNLNRMF